MSLSIEPYLDMGIWSGDGIVWLPKQFFPTRNDAKRFALNEDIYDYWTEIRCRTEWMKRDRSHDASSYDEFESYYVRAEPGEDGAFECWRLGG
jgi:hypothetical protein